MQLTIRIKVFLSILLCALTITSFANERIITLTPNLTRLVCEAGACKDLVAVSVDSNHPKSIKQLPRIGGYANVNFEKILALKPSFVLAWRGETSNNAIDQLRKLSVKVVVLSADKLVDIAHVLKQIGKLAGTSKQANIAAVKFLQQYSYLKHTYARTHKLRVFWQYSDFPLYGAGGIGLQNQILSLCGGKNIFANIKRQSMQVSYEAVIARNPQIILIMSPLKPNNWQKWTSVSAVKQHRLYVVDANQLAGASADILAGAAKVCRLLK